MRDMRKVCRWVHPAIQQANLCPNIALRRRTKWKHFVVRTILRYHRRSEISRSTANITSHRRRKERITYYRPCNALYLISALLRRPYWDCEIPCSLHKMDHALEHHKSYIGRPVAELPSPALVISLPLLKRNTEALHRDVEALGIGFRPHVKTLKVSGFNNR